MGEKVSRVTIRVDAVVDDACGPEETASLLGKGIATIWRWIRDDKIIAVKVGGRTLIPRQEIERLKKQDLPDQGNG
jgi:excisionase family DNA binding protein